MKCLNCQGDFEPYSDKVLQKFCKQSCGGNFAINIPDWCKNVPTSTVGTVAEIMVAVDLMKKGYEIYRNISPQGINDLVAYKDKKFYGIDVKTGYTKKDGKIQKCGSRYRSTYRAVVYHSINKIVYEPEIL